MVGQTIDCKTDKQFLLDDPGVHANDHQTHALGHRKKTRAVGDHELHVETELPERLQQAIHGQIDTGIFNFRRRISSWRGHTTSSNSFFRASSSKTYFKQIRAKHQYSLISPKTRIAKHADARQLDYQADRHEIAERCGVMMTADHEGIQHYPCKTQYSSGNAEKSENILTSKRKSKIHFYEQFFWIYQSLRRAELESWEIFAAKIRNKWNCRTTVLVQSGLQESWRAEAMECYSYLRNVQDLLEDGQTPFEGRFNWPFDGPTIPFGAEVKFFPTSSKQVHQFVTKVLLGIFVGYASNAERS